MIDKISKKVIRNIVNRYLEGAVRAIIIWTLPLIKELTRRDLINILVLASEIPLKSIFDALLLEENISSELREIIDLEIEVSIIHEDEFMYNVLNGYPPEIIALRLGEEITNSNLDIDSKVTMKSLEKFVDLGFISLGMAITNLARREYDFAKTNYAYSLFYSQTAISLRHMGKIVTSFGDIKINLEKIGRKEYWDFFAQARKYFQEDSSCLEKAESLSDVFLANDNIIKLMMITYLSAKFAWEEIHKDNIAEMDRFLAILNSISSEEILKVDIRGTKPKPIMRIKTPFEEKIIELK